MKHTIFMRIFSMFLGLNFLKLGVVADDEGGSEVDEKTKAFVKSVAPIIKEQVDEGIKAAKEEDQKTFDEVMAELKAIREEKRKILEKNGVDQSVKEKIMVETFKAVAGQAQVSEEQFKQAFQNATKAAFNSESTAGEGAEFVFTQFEEDVLNVMKTYNLVNELNIFPIKGTELKLPKGINNIVTNWVWEGTTIGKSKVGSAFVTINTYKAACLVPFTEELLKDNMTTPKYYEMVVKMIGESQAAFLEDQVLNGTDATRVEGVLVNTSVGTATLPAGVTTLRGATAAQLDDLLVDVDSTIGAEYQANQENQVIVMSKYVRNIYKKAKTSTGAYMFPELRTSNPELDSCRVLISHKAPMQNQAADVAGATAFVRGDFKSFFGLVSAEDLVLTRGYADGDFEADLQSVKARKRYGGKCLYGEAFGKAKNAAS